MALHASRPLNLFGAVQWVIKTILEDPFDL